MAKNGSKPVVEAGRVDLDRVERMMIALLQKDGRLGIQALARKLGVSDVTARRKLRRLLKDEIVQIVAAVDPFQVGFESPVIIGLKIDRSRIDEIATKLCEHPSIRFVAAATGKVDLLVEVVAVSNHELAEFVLGYLASIEGILDTETSLVLRINKQTWNWGVRGIEEAGAPAAANGAGASRSATKARAGRGRNA
ncbi:MAG TPA: Lrp/AsnC family transcriptional regulator [Patescibacteria group bacterium]|nr:Lrp/AsnC family transcriptional regulator [Patescibacteria group bacterium]